METVERYFSVGADRVILGTAAVTDEAFLEAAVKAYGERIAVGVDIQDGKVAIRGWTESSGLDAFAFCEKMQALGVRTLICTDISKDHRHISVCLWYHYFRFSISLIFRLTYRLPFPI